MYWNEIRDETRTWDATVAALAAASDDAQRIIEDLRTQLDEARAKIASLEEEVDELRAREL